MSDKVVPVGIPEIAERLNVKRQTVDNWRHGKKLDGEQFPEPTWAVGGRPAWNWPVIERWARRTGRLK